MEAQGFRRKAWPWLWWFIALLGCVPAGRAELQFDVFLGLDDRVREGHWFPIAFEIFNDGPSFNGTVVVGTEAGFDTQQRRFTIELPTGTRKRAVIPVFSAAGRYSRWEARLLDDDGKVVAERSGLQAKDTAPHVPILGAMPRTFGGLPALPQVKNRTPEFVPGVARLQADYLPANPIALEGLTAWYLNSERAADLKPEQADALLTWIHDGGHLIVAIEQPSDINALPWLRALLPLAPESITNRPMDGCFERWLAGGRRPFQAAPMPRRATLGDRGVARPGRAGVVPPAAAESLDPYSRLEPQTEFENAEMPIVLGRQRDGDTILALGDHPLIVSAARGRGMVTSLAFSPEREPFRSWKNRTWFWAKLIGVPAELLDESASLDGGGISIDGLFGAMLDSRQVRKLPISALLLLLVVYLIVIGPFDQWILKRTGRQMWTWVTFPVYVVLFSGLIYFIGYRLRAGDLELNELQIVDQLPRGEGAALRGRTWLSIYSPGNARYRLASDQPFATFRSEFQAGGPGRGESGKLDLRQAVKGFEAEAYVPVWVNQLFSSDWVDAAPALITGRVALTPDGASVTLTNASNLHFSQIKVALGDQIHDLGELGAGQRIDRPLRPDTGRPVDEMLVPIHGAMAAVQQRRFAFGNQGSGWLDLNLDGVILASLARRTAGLTSNPGETFVAPAGFDLDHLLRRGDAVVFAWIRRQGLASPIHRFSPARMKRDTILRLALPVGPPS